MLISIDAQAISEEQAREMLEETYHVYFQRSVDQVGLKHYAPIIVRYGFQGLVFVINQLVYSEEMSKRVTEELSRIYREYLGREIDTGGRQAYDAPVRFFRERGRSEVIESIKSSPEYARRTKHIRVQEQQIDDILSAIKAGQATPGKYEQLAQLNAAAQKFEAAIEAYSHAIEIQPRAAYYFERGNLYFRLEKYANAVSDFEEALTHQYQPAGEPNFKIGLSQERLNKLNEAIESYQQAIRLGPRDLAQTKYRLAIAYQQIGQMEEAVNTFTAALESGPSIELRPQIFLLRARAYVSLGALDKAAHDFAKFVGRTTNQKRLIQGSSSTVYFVFNAMKQGIPDPPTLNFIALENSLQLLERVSTIELNAYPEAEPIRSVLEYELISGPDGAIYLVEGSKRRWIPNPETFVTLALDATKVTKLSQEEIAKVPLGRPIRSALAQQPLQRSQLNGAYFLIENGQRRRIPNVETIVALGYSVDDAQVVTEESVVV